jgi:hypothetical protein
MAGAQTLSLFLQKDFIKPTLHAAGLKTWLPVFQLIQLMPSGGMIVGVTSFNSNNWSTRDQNPLPGVVMVGADCSNPLFTSTFTSTRRFWVRPSRVRLSAIGCDSP